MQPWLWLSVPQCSCECVWAVCVKWCLKVPVLWFSWAHPVNKQFIGRYLVVAMLTASATCLSCELPTRRVSIVCMCVCYNRKETVEEAEADKGTE